MDRKILFVGLGSFLLIGIVVVATFVFGKPDSFRATAYGEPYPAAAEIELTRSDGSSFQLSEMRGKVALLFFGYTSCPDVCPTTLAKLTQALRELDAEDAKQAQVLFVTVDPEQDTPQRMQEYVNHFNADFIGLSGTEAELQKVWNDYGVYREIVKGTSVLGYTVSHTARITVIDRNGNLRLSFAIDVPVEDIVHDLKIVLKEKK